MRIFEGVFPDGTIAPEYIMSDILAAAKTLIADSRGNTALHSCKTGAEVDVLVRLGLDVNAKNSGRGTPLHSACGNSRLEVAAALIAAGADMNAKSITDSTPLHYACRNGNLEIAQTLIAAGADLNVKADGGLTPLHRACRRGHLEVAEALIAAGADVNAMDSVGWTPLDYCKTDEMKALLSPKEMTPKDLLTALKELLAQYE